MVLFLLKRELAALLQQENNIKKKKMKASSSHIAKETREDIAVGAQRPEVLLLASTRKCIEDVISPEGGNFFLINSHKRG